ncbi:hypothetical protein D3C86_2074360 [compost metagenome]
MHLVLAVDHPQRVPREFDPFVTYVGEAVDFVELPGPLCGALVYDHERVLAAVLLPNEAVPFF